MQELLADTLAAEERAATVIQLATELAAVDARRAAQQQEVGWAEAAERQASSERQMGVAPEAVAAVQEQPVCDSEVLFQQQWAAPEENVSQAETACGTADEAHEVEVAAPQVCICDYACIELMVGCMC